MPKPFALLDYLGIPENAELRQQVIEGFGEENRKRLRQVGVPEVALDQVILAGACYEKEDARPRLSHRDVEAYLLKVRDALQTLLDIEGAKAPLELIQLRYAARVWLKSMGPEIPEDELATPAGFHNRLISELHYYTEALKEWREHSWSGHPNNIELALTFRVCQALGAAGCPINKTPKGLVVKTIQTLYEIATSRSVLPQTVINWVARYQDLAREYPGLFP